MASDCFICQTIRAADEGRNPGFVARLRSGYVFIRLGGQYYRGYSIFSSRRCVPELHGLGARERSAFLADMALVAEAMFHSFRPAKLNYELLGNTVPHLHWHLIPRYRDDPKPLVPAWENAEFRAWRPAGTAAEAAHLRRTKTKLLRALREVAGARLVRSFKDER